MRELSLHILDIAQNSIAASASLISISIDENPAVDLLTIVISDNGSGIAPKHLNQITDPFILRARHGSRVRSCPLFPGGSEKRWGT